MKVEELRKLARAAGPLAALDAALDARGRVLTYRDLVSRFRERVTKVLNSLTLGLTVEPGLEQELRLLADALPHLRRKIEAGARRGGPGWGE
jgi:hypothetical protein